MEQSLNMFDLVFIGLVGILAFIGLARGAIKEVFSIVNILLAAAITILMRPIVSSMLIEKVRLEVFADIISNSVIFTISYVAISLLFSGALKTIGEKIPAYINQPFGFILGFLKGYLIMSIVIITMFSIYDVPANSASDGILPDFITNAKTYNLAKEGANFIKPIYEKLFKNSFSSTESLKSIFNREDPLNGLEEFDYKSQQRNSGTRNLQQEKLGKDLQNINDRYDREYQMMKANDTGYSEKQIRKKDGLVEIFADDEDLVAK